MKELKSIKLPSTYDANVVNTALFHASKGDAWCYFYEKGDDKLEHPFVFCHGTPSGKLKFGEDELDPGTFLNKTFPEDRARKAKDITFITCYGWFFRRGIWKGIPVNHINPTCATRMGVGISGDTVYVYKDASVVNLTLKQRWEDWYISHLIKPFAVCVLAIRRLIGRPRKAIKQYS